jgi:hypothetical protein
MNRYLFDLLKQIEDGARRLASTITDAEETRLREITLVHVELEEITNALKAFKSEVAGGAWVGHRRQIDQERRQLGASDWTRNVTGCLLA